MYNRHSPIALLVGALLGSIATIAQPVTGIWRGKVIRGNGPFRQAYKLEVKLIKKGDSLTGTSYYYASPGQYARYTVKGYLGVTDNSIHWWDDQLVESRSGGLKLGSVNQQPLLSVADFNCPGGEVMQLDGKSRSESGEKEYELHLQKYEQPDFEDEWDPLIAGYFDGGADPYLIDSVGRLALIGKTPDLRPATGTVAVTPPEKATTPLPGRNPGTGNPAGPPPAVRPAPLTIEEKFARRKNIPAVAIPVTGDEVVFSFYDNAEVDGDSIAVFLNGRLLQAHIRLTDKAYTLRILVAELQASNELVMVAENLGSIPPNTAYMEAWNGSKRYTARLESTELHSAMIRLQKP